MSEAQKRSEGPLETSEVKNELREAVQDLRQQFGKIESTLHADGSIRTTGERFLELGPLFVQLGEALVRWDEVMEQQEP